MSERGRERATGETLAIPQAIRDQVDDRDKRFCRVCGRYQGDARALHHILYGGDLVGMGGRRVHEVDALVTVCWSFGGGCHELVHGNKKLWQPLLLTVVQQPGTTALQLRRWQVRRQSPTRHPNGLH